MQNVDTQIHSGTSAFAGVGGLAQPTDESAAPEQKVLAPLLSKEALIVTTPTQAAVVSEMIQSAHETAMATVKNMVDTPEERQRKIEQRERDDAKRLRTKEDLAERDAEKERLAEQLKDEVAIQRQNPV